MTEAERATRMAFSLVEVVMALLVFQVGLLALLTLSVRALEVADRARDTEHAVAALRALADSLGSMDSVGTGESSVGRLRLRWRPAGAGAAGAEALAPDGRVLLDVRVPLGPR